MRPTRAGLPARIPGVIATRCNAVLFVVAVGAGVACSDNSRLPTDPARPHGIANVTAALASSAGAASWNATLDFSTTSNPNGAWTAGWTPAAGGALTPFPAIALAAGGVLATWYDPANNDIGTPTFSRNISATTFAGIPAGAVQLHPGCRAGERSVLRWTAPNAGTYTLTAQFFHGDFGNTDASVLVDGNAAAPLFVAASTANDPFFRAKQTLSAGETVDFTVGTGGDGCFFDSTPLTAIVTPPGGLAPLNRGNASEYVKLCGTEQPPTGYIAVDFEVGLSAQIECGGNIFDNPLSLITYRTYDDKPIGFTMSVCSSQTVPAGWVVLMSFGPQLVAAIPSYTTCTDRNIVGDLIGGSLIIERIS